MDRARPFLPESTLPLSVGGARPRSCVGCNTLWCGVAAPCPSRGWGSGEIGSPAPTASSCLCFPPFPRLPPPALFSVALLCLWRVYLPLLLLPEASCFLPLFPTFSQSPAPTIQPLCPCPRSDQMGNKASYIHLQGSDLRPQFHQFTAVVSGLGRQGGREAVPGQGLPVAGPLTASPSAPAAASPQRQAHGVCQHAAAAGNDVRLSTAAASQGLPGGTPRPRPAAPPQAASDPRLLCKVCIYSP